MCPAQTVQLQCPELGHMPCCHDVSQRHCTLVSQSIVVCMRCFTHVPPLTQTHTQRTAKVQDLQVRAPLAPHSNRCTTDLPNATACHHHALCRTNTNTPSRTVQLQCPELGYISCCHHVPQRHYALVTQCVVCMRCHTHVPPLRQTHTPRTTQVQDLQMRAPLALHTNRCTADAPNTTLCHRHTSCQTHTHTQTHTSYQIPSSLSVVMLGTCPAAIVSPNATAPSSPSALLAAFDVKNTCHHYRTRFTYTNRGCPNRPNCTPCHRRTSCVTHTHTCTHTHTHTHAYTHVVTHTQSHAHTHTHTHTYPTTYRLSVWRTCCHHTPQRHCALVTQRLACTRRRTMHTHTHKHTHTLTLRVAVLQTPFNSSSCPATSLPLHSSPTSCLPPSFVSDSVKFHKAFSSTSSCGPTVPSSIAHLSSVTSSTSAITPTRNGQTHNLNVMGSCSRHSAADTAPARAGGARWGVTVVRDELRTRVNVAVAGDSRGHAC